MEYIKDSAFGVVAVKKTGNEVKFLLVKHNDGHWGFPKGHLNDGETELDCAKRELEEETGIKSFRLRPEIKFEENYTFEKDGEHYDKSVTYFLCLIDGNANPKPQEGFAKEITAVALLNYEQARLTLTYDGTKQLLDKAYHQIDTMIKTGILDKF